MKNWQGVQHGEILIVPINKLPKGKLEQHTNFIVGHSETGHHHVLEATVPFDIHIKGAETYIKFNGDTALVHKKTSNKHATKIIPAGVIGKVFRKTEYDPFAGLIRQVKD